MSEPDCVIPAARHLRNGSRLHLIVAEREGRFEACLPVQRVARWRSIPRAAISTRIRRMTWDATPLVDRECGGEALYAVISHLAEQARRRGPKLLVLEWLNDSGPIGDYVRTAARRLGLPVRVYDSWEQPFMARRDEPTYASMRSKKALRDRQRQLRALGREIGGEPHIVDRGGDPSAVAIFSALEAAGYKATTGVAMATQPGEEEWFTEMAMRFSVAGRFHLLSLEAGETVIAMECLIDNADDGIVMIKVSYDERYGKWSPGVQLHLGTLDWFHHETTASWMDLCTFKDNMTLLHQYPERRRVTTLVIALRGSRDRAWLAMLGLDPLWRRGVYWIGSRLGIRQTTLNAICEGGSYDELSLRRAKR